MLLLDLLPLREAFTARNATPPTALLNAIDRMMPMMRYFRHGDGNFAHFNGMGPTPPDLLATLLAYDTVRGAPVASAQHAGYERVEAKDLLLLMDGGAPPPIAVSQEAHAGCLSFELSVKQQRLVANCGLPATSRENWRQVARATAAHSTVTFNDTSSCRFLELGSFRKVLGSTVVGGPDEVVASREQRDDGVLLRASHDGYADQFNIVHQRAILISPDGNQLEGEDLFVPAHGEDLPSAQDAFAVRFHLHPTIKANRLSDGRGVMLVLPDREAWTFNAHEDLVELEESVYLAGPDGPRRTMQMVIYGHARKVPRVNWTFTRASVAAGIRHRAGEEPQLPL